MVNIVEGNWGEIMRPLRAQGEPPPEPPKPPEPPPPPPSEPVKEPKDPDQPREVA